MQESGTIGGGGKASPLSSPDAPGGMGVAIARLKDVGAQVLSQRRPWSELMDRSAYSRPDSFAEATSRVRKNVNYFKVNYLIWILTVLVVCMLANPASLFVLSGIGAAWVYLFFVRGDAPLAVGGRVLSEREKLMAASGASVLVIFFLTNVGSVLFSAICIGLAGICAHGALRVPDDLFLDPVNDSGSFLPSFSLQPTAGSMA